MAASHIQHTRRNGDRCEIVGRDAQHKIYGLLARSLILGVLLGPAAREGWIVPLLHCAPFPTRGQSCAATRADEDTARMCRVFATPWVILPRPADAVKAPRRATWQRSASCRRHIVIGRHLGGDLVCAAGVDPLSVFT